MRLLLINYFPPCIDFKDCSVISKIFRLPIIEHNLINYNNASLIIHCWIFLELNSINIYGIVFFLEFNPHHDV